MTLKDLGIGKSAVVKSVGGEGALRQHFLDMGIIPGTEIVHMLRGRTHMPSPSGVSGQSYSARYTTLGSSVSLSRAMYISSYIPPLKWR